MSQTITLKGIAWDHPRGHEPLQATSNAFAELYQGVSIKWNIRSLKEFGDMQKNLFKTLLINHENS